MRTRVDPLPAFYNDLDTALGELWRLLVEAAGNRSSPFHLPALATVDARSRPRLRTVVLRAADPETGTLRFHCDRRSDKAAEIAVAAPVALQAYDRETTVQIRIEGRAALHTDDALADAAWAGSQTMSRVCYGVAPAPGTTILEGGAYALPGEDTRARDGRKNFCAVSVRAERLDFLYLDRRGHRRAAWARGEDGWRGTWLVP